MISDIVFGLGFVAVIEGLVLALAPLRFEQLLRSLHALGADRMRMIGLITIAGGILLIWLVRG